MSYDRKCKALADDFLSAFDKDDTDDAYELAQIIQDVIEEFINDKGHEQ